MPKTKQFNFMQERVKDMIPPPNYLNELFSRYMKAQHITTDDLAAIFKCSGQNIRYKLSRPAAAWKIGEIENFCNALNCPIEAACKAAALSKK